jgi:peptide deformylase
MAVRPIIYVNNALLRQKSKKVRQFNSTLRTLADDMVETMRENNGLGLAAPQVGALQRLITIELPENEEDPQSGKLYVVVNPEVAKAEGEEEENPEGCLSIPDWYGLVKRAPRAIVKGQDLKGKPIRIKANGLLARVFQHEIDHLNGVLFIDLVDDPDKIWHVERKEQVEEEAGHSGEDAAAEPLTVEEEPVKELAQ